MNSAESILGSEFTSLCRVELFCTNTGSGVVPAQGFLSCLSRDRCALNVWKVLHRGDGKLCMKGVLKALLRVRAQVFPKKDNKSFLLRCVLKCLLHGAGLEVNSVLFCRFFLV